MPWRCGGVVPWLVCDALAAAAAAAAAVAACSPAACAPGRFVASPPGDRAVLRNAHMVRNALVRNGSTGHHGTALCHLPRRWEHVRGKGTGKGTVFAANGSVLASEPQDKRPCPNPVLP